MKKRILFLCTGNSARSQMAEGLARYLSRGALEVYTAGLEPKGLHPLAVAVMDEIGIDIRQQRSKPIDPDLMNRMNVIITVCGNAEERCPVTPPHIQREHWPIEDPAGVSGSEEDRLRIFRKTRDEIQDRMTRFLKTVIGRSP